MPSPNLDTLLPLLLPEVNECPLDTVRLAVRRAARDFCRASTAWRILHAPILLVDGQRSYVLTLPADTELVLIAGVFGPSRELKGEPIDALPSLLPNWLNAEGLPRYFNSTDYAAVSLYPLPKGLPPGAYVAPRLAVSPTLTAADLDPLLTGRYAEALVAGALARLHGMPERPWSAAELAQAEEADFQRRIGIARIETLQERVSGSLRVQPRPFGA